MNKAQKSRSVHYRVNGDLQGEEADKLLSRAKERGLVTNYDVGRQLTWFEGAPGADLRALRRDLETIATQRVDSLTHGAVVRTKSK